MEDVLALSREQKLLLSDTAVADVFIADIMPRLPGEAVKLYLHLTQAWGRGARQVTLEDLQRHFDFREKDCRELLLVLQKEGLIRLQQEEIQLNDIKASALERHLKARPVRDTTTLDVSAFEQTVVAISDRHYQGVMGPGIYQEIDRYFFQYRFAPPVIYALFEELAQRNKLGHAGYARSIAKNWHEHQITSYESLLAYQREYEAGRDLCSQISRKLRRPLTEYDEEMIFAWQQELGYPFEIIDLALRRSTKATSGRSLTFYDKILREWHAAGLKDAPAIQNYEDQRKARLGRTRSEGKVPFSETGDLARYYNRPETKRVIRVKDNDEETS